MASIESRRICHYLQLTKNKVSDNLKMIPLPELFDFDATHLPLSLPTTKAFGNKPAWL